MGAVAANTDAVWELVDQDEELERVGTGFTFTEGPIWHPTENHLTFSDIPANKLYRWHQESGISVYREPSNMANGWTHSNSYPPMTPR